MDEHHSWYHCDTYIDLTKYMSMTYILWSSDFASYLEDYLMEKNVVLGIMDQCDAKIDLVKYMWVSDLYFMVH